MSAKITVKAAIVVEEILHDFVGRLGLTDVPFTTEVDLYTGALSGHDMVDKTYIVAEIEETFFDAVTGWSKF